MRYNIVKTENYLLIVDDSKIKEVDSCIDRVGRLWDNIEGCFVSTMYDAKKIIAHLPLNNSPIIEGVDLLPPLEDEVEKKLNENCNPKIAAIMIKGYNKAKEKYKYTEEDLKYMFECGRNYQNNAEITFKVSLDYIQQPKLPVGFECETADFGHYEMAIDTFVKHGEKPKTTTNSEGQTVWVGKYIY
jgi:hypothetical protein